MRVVIEASPVGGAGWRGVGLGERDPEDTQQTREEQGLVVGESSAQHGVDVVLVHMVAPDEVLDELVSRRQHKVGRDDEEEVFDGLVELGRDVRGLPQAVVRGHAA